MSAPGPPSSSPSSGGHGGHNHHRELKERSRNARAQARHRAKRKAYIEQLEATVTKLQCMVPLSPEQINALSAPQMRVRELEDENRQLRNELLRYQTGGGGNAPPYSPAPLGPPPSGRGSAGITGMYSNDGDYDRRTRYSDSRSSGFPYAQGPPPSINTPLLPPPSSVSSSSSSNNTATYSSSNNSHSRMLPAPNSTYFGGGGPHGPAYSHHLSNSETQSSSSTSSPPASALPPIHRRDSPGYRNTSNHHHMLPSVSSSYGYGDGRVPPMKTEDEAGYGPTPYNPNAHASSYQSMSPTSPTGWYPPSDRRH